MTLQAGFDYIPLEHQRPFWHAMMVDGKTRCALVWHRRGGKDLSAWAHMILRSVQTPGNYFYFFPTAALGKKILWNGKTRDGKPFLDYIPPELLLKKHDTDLRLTLQSVGGDSLIQIIGTEDIDKSAVGTSCHGAIFSEYSTMDPRAWIFVSPILRETGGWAVFCYTPRGHNHGYKLYHAVKDRPNWHCERQSILDTGLFEDADLDDDRAAGVDEATIQQEWYCSFEADVHGAYFSGAIARARLEGRIARVDYDPILPVHTFWDLGVGDPTGLWFVQIDPSGVYRLLEYIEAANEGLPYFIHELGQRPYTYGMHVGPHDIQVREWGSGMSRVDIAAELGLDFFPGEKVDKADQIEAGRALLARCVFDANKCERGLDALAAYHANVDPLTHSMAKHPVHDWSSHAADAFMLAATHVDVMDGSHYSRFGSRQSELVVINDFNPYTNEGYAYGRGTNLL